jgi:hypothetical protein
MLPVMLSVFADILLAMTLPVGTMTLVTTLPFASITVFAGSPVLKPPRELNGSAAMFYPKICLNNIFILVS